MDRSIAPAILAQDKNQFNEQMNKVQDFAERIHLDFTDGNFAPVPSVALNEMWVPEGVKFDIHAMVWNPEQHLVDIVNMKPNAAIFHAECNGNLPAVFATLRQYDIKPGLAILRSTVPETIKDLIKQVDHILIFSGNLGQFGGTAHLMQLEKIKMIKKMNPEAEIGWDGGVNDDNTYTLVQGGVNVLNVGGYLQHSDDPKASYDLLVSEMNRQGVI